MTGHWSAALLGATSIAATAVLASAIPTSARPGEDQLRSELRQLARLRVLFGHQSIGTNILEGLAALSTQAGERVPIMEVRTAREVDRPGIGHLFVGVNKDPRSKLHDLDRALPPDARVDAVLFKLCYVDIDEKTDVTALFSEYQKVMSVLAARHPRTAFVYVTTPLQGDPGWAKTTLKQLLGRGGGAVADNARREQFNDALRRAYEGRARVFDLARLESTRPDGGRETTRWGGATVPVLVPAFSDDSAHLNLTGRTHVARALVSLLASLATEPSGSARP